MSANIVIGTRQSALALWQTHHVVSLLRSAHPTLHIEVIPFSTRGDEILDKALPAIGGKGVFTEALESALLDGDIDYAVHSLKDVPTEDTDGLTLGAITQRAAPDDALISRQGFTFTQLPQGAVIGTSSRRRAAQLLAHRPDIIIKDIRGNVGTRLEKALAPDSPYDAIVLALAGLERLNLTHHITQILPQAVMLPAAGQGALVVQCRNDAESLRLLTPIHHTETAVCVGAERAFLAGLGGGCSLPIGAFATIYQDTLHLQARICSLDGQTVIDVEGNAPNTLADALTLADSLVQTAIQNGAGQIIAGIQG